MKCFALIAKGLLICMAMVFVPQVLAGNVVEESMDSGLFIRNASLTAVFPNAAGTENPVKPDVPENATLDPVELILDDGIRENDIGIGGTSELMFLNRFTPDPGLFPFTLNQIQVFFSTQGMVNVGDDIQLVVFENTSGNVDPAVGSNWLASFPATVSVVDAWSVYDLSAPVQLNGPGDVLIGVIGLEVPGTSYWPASLDQTATQGRSWIGWWNTSPPPDPLVLPSDNWTLIDAYFPGNWMVRGYGETVVIPTATPTATATPTQIPTNTPTATAPPTQVPTNTPVMTATPSATPSGQCVNNGDVIADGELTSGDAQRAFLIVLGLYVPTAEEYCAADCNGDAEVTANDAQLIFLSILGLDNCAEPLLPI